MQHEFGIHSGQLNRLFDACCLRIQILGIWVSHANAPFAKRLAEVVISINGHEVNDTWVSHANAPFTKRLAELVISIRKDQVMTYGYLMHSPSHGSPR